MQEIKLKDNYTLRIEAYENRLRLVILDGDFEVVCRKESKKNMISFLNRPNGQLFKGRLKLQLKEQKLGIYVKGICIDSIDLNVIKELLEHFN